MNEGEIQPLPSERVAEWTSHYFSFYIHTLKAASGYFFFQYSTISLSLRVFRTVQMDLSQNASWSVGGSQCQPRGASSRQVVPVQSLITEAGGRRRQEAACLTVTGRPRAQHPRESCAGEHEHKSNHKTDDSCKAFFHNYNTPCNNYFLHHYNYDVY